jgi:glycosyltransferase involved in cell wall biosynthesis
MAVHRPRFFYFPGILKNLDARFYAMGVRNWLQKFIKDWRPDLLDAHFVWPDGVAVAALGREFGIPYTITLRGKLYECLKVTSQREQCAAALRNAAKVISVSRLLAGEAEKMGVSHDRVKIIPNGVDRDFFHPRDKLACRKKLGLPEKARLIVTVAHLGHRKGHHEVIRAFAGLPGDVRLVLVGGAAQGGTPEIIRSIAAKAGVEKRLILTGPKPYHSIPLYFSAADVSVLASYREGCPNVVLESLACGTPVVASDVGAVPDILREPEGGRIVPPRQIEPLRYALDMVLKENWNPETVVQLSGVKSWDEVADTIQGIL